MKVPSTQSLFDMLDWGYGALLFTIILVASGEPSLLAIGPILLTVVLFCGQLLVTRREEAAARIQRPRGAKAGHAWGAILLAYIVIAVLAAGFRAAFSGGGLQF